MRASLGGASPIDPVTSSRTHTRNSRSPQRTTSTASRNTEASDNNPSSAQEEASSDHHSLRSIKRDFDAARDKFVYPSSLTFTSDGSLLSMRNTPTQLFLDHQRNIRRFRKMLENLGTEAHPKVFQEEKGHLLREIQDHQTFLDNTVQQFWDLEQATQAYRARASNMSDMREKIIIHENGMLIYVFS